jgi:hypothetical protein
MYMEGTTVKPDKRKGLVTVKMVRGLLEQPLQIPSKSPI